MIIFKKNKLVLLLILFMPALQAQDKFFFRDTVIENTGLNFHVEDAMGKGDLVKLKLIISNPSDHYVIINPDSILLIIQDTVQTRYHKNIVVAPKDIAKITIVFEGLRALYSKAVRLQIGGISITDQVIRTYPPVKMKAELDARMEYGSLSIIITELKARGKDYVVKTSLSYSGQNFLAVRYQRVKLKVPEGEFMNERKSPAFYNNDKPAQNLLAIFPFINQKGVLVRADLILDNAFEEYSLKPIGSMKFGLSKMSITESRNHKEKKEEVIQEIE